MADPVVPPSPWRTLPPGALTPAWVRQRKAQRVLLSRTPPPKRAPDPVNEPD